MKKIILRIGIISLCVNLFAQNVNGVSTNPLNPINPVFLPWANQFLGSGITYDPFLNAPAGASVVCSLCVVHLCQYQLITKAN